MPPRIAIIGAGPAGLGALIALSKLEDVDVQVYEQAKELREVGAGISISNNGWKVLELLGVPRIPEESFFVSPGRRRNEHWNGRTAEFLRAQLEPPGIPDSHLHIRTQRSRLQQALLKVAPVERIHLKKRLLEVRKVDLGETTLIFEDGCEATADLVVGADGIRSVIRRIAFSDHAITYTGKVSYRAIFPINLVSSIPLATDRTIFWHGERDRVQNWFYSSPLGGGLFEVTAMTAEPSELGTKVSWGQPATVDALRNHFEEYHPTVRAIIDAIPPASLGQYASFSGPQLTTIVDGGRIALLGDASHPLSGAFGSGATFALEDAWTLAIALAHARENALPLEEALRLFDETRSAFYSLLYAELKLMAAAAEKGKDLPWDERVKDRMAERWGDLEWIYSFDVKGAWEDQLRKDALEKAQRELSETTKEVNGAAEDLRARL
ncbi:hypothetical protein JCM10449v2_000192 [Rhodotorula kratochvilovae]